MYLIKSKKKTAGSRHYLKLAKFTLLKRNNIIKNLNLKKHKNYGRCKITGHITIRHKGNGCKKIFKKINFTNKTLYSIILGITYDANRNAFLALNFDLYNKTFFNTIATLHTYPGSLITCQQIIKDLRLGIRTKLQNIPTGTILTNLALSKGQISQYIRAAGTYGQLLQKTQNSALIRLPSNKVIQVPLNSYGTIGINANILNNKQVLGKAGRNRLKGIRPSVRGIAMNPVDHPHGGRTNGGRPSVTPWGKPTKGKPTRKK